MPELSILDERLAEIDRRLRTIQTDLAPAERAPDVDATLASPLPPPIPLRVAPEPEPEPEPSGRDAAPLAPQNVPLDSLLGQLRDLTAAHERLLELHRDLLGQYAAVLEHPAPATMTAALTAGPFADSAAVRSFAAAVAAAPGVERVDVREYLDGGRVVLEARLATL